MLSFLQQGLERRLSPSTLKVSCCPLFPHATTTSMVKSVGKHDLVVRFLRGARRLNPPRPPPYPLGTLLWCFEHSRLLHLSLAVSRLKDSVYETLLLVALASIKRVGDLQAFSVDESCLEFGPGNGHVVLRPRPGYVPKIPTTSLQGPGIEPASAAPRRRQTQPWLCSVQFATCDCT